jgi:hypothetical protein
MLEHKLNKLEVCDKLLNLGISSLEHFQDLFRPTLNLLRQEILTPG